MKMETISLRRAAGHKGKFISLDRNFYMKVSADLEEASEAKEGSELTLKKSGKDFLITFDEKDSGVELVRVKSGKQQSQRLGTSSKIAKTLFCKALNLNENERYIIKVDEEPEEYAGRLYWRLQLPEKEVTTNKQNDIYDGTIK